VRHRSLRSTNLLAVSSSPQWHTLTALAVPTLPPLPLPQWDMTGGGFPYGHLSRRASAAILSPVSFHHLNVDQIALYHRMSIVESRGLGGELYRWDFSSHFLKEFILDVPELGARVRLLFGVAVDVMPIKEQRPWRRDFGDPVVFVPRDDGRRFEMVISKVPEIFNGDGCDAPISDPVRMPVRKSAVVAIRCGSCADDTASSTTTSAAMRQTPLPGWTQGGALKPNNVGTVCEVRRPDSCTLRIDLAINCPARQVVYAPQLDVGWTAGGSELVKAGAPTSCSTPPSPPLLASSALLGTDAEGGYREAMKSPGSLRLFMSLTHGSLAVSPPVARVSSLPGCEATVEAEHLLTRGGTLQAAGGSKQLLLRCGCVRSVVKSQHILANATLTLRLRDFTSLTITLPIACIPRDS
jgi:hypothetical protein